VRQHAKCEAEGAHPSGEDFRDVSPWERAPGAVVDLDIGSQFRFSLIIITAAVIVSQRLTIISR
jgi:hypothetical protein